MTASAGVFEWHVGQPGLGLVVGQVYGWLFDNHGRVLLQRTPEGFNLPGGTPEPWDDGEAGTLVREAMEESQVTVADSRILGFETLAGPDGAATPPRAFVRMAGRIAAFHERRPDPDGGRLLGRQMVALPTAVELLAWGQSGAAQAELAGHAAERFWGLPVSQPTAPDSGAV